MTRTEGSRRVEGRQEDLALMSGVGGSSQQKIEEIGPYTEPIAPWDRLLGFTLQPLVPSSCCTGEHEENRSRAPTYETYVER